MASDGSVVIVIDGDDSKFKSALGKLGGVASSAMSGVTKAIGAVSAGLSAAAGFSLKVGSDFEASMSQVAATMGMTTEEIHNGSGSFELLKQAAKDAGSTTSFSATEAAEALNYLALAGYDAETSADALPAVLNLAAAGGLDLAYASDLATDAMAALGIEASSENLTRFGDEMARTSSKANTSVAQLGEAILTVGGTAKGLAGGTTELNAALGVLANRGIKGSEGGTALRNIILALSAPTDKAAASMKALGLEVFDAEGNMRPLNEVFRDLDGALATMTEGQKTQVLNEIFNKVDLKSAQAMLAGCGEEFDNLSAAIADSGGAMQNMADTQLDNLQGALTIAKSGLEGLGISIYEGIQEPAKEAVRTFTDMLSELQNAFNEGGMAGMVRAAGDVMARLVLEIANAAPKIIDTAVSLIQAFLTGIQNNLPALAQGAAGIITSLAQGILTLLPQLAEVAVQLITALAKGLAAALPQILPAAAQAVAQLATGLASHAGELVSAALGLIRSLAFGLIEALPVLIDAIPEVIAGLVTGILENLPQIIAVGLEIIVALAVGIIQAIPKLIMAIPKIIAAVVDGFTGHDWAGTGRQSMEALAKGIEGGTSSVKSAGKSVLNAATNSVSSLPNTLQTTGRNSANRLAEGLRNGKETARSAAKNVADSVENEIKNTSAKASAIGRNISEGVANGIQKGKSSAVNAMANMAASILAKAKSALGIHSPSRVMREQVGRFIPQGVEAGISEELPQLERSVAARLAGFTDQLRAAVEGETLRVSARLVPAAVSTPAPVQTDGSRNQFTINVYPSSEMSVQQARDVGREIGAETQRELRRRGLAGI